MSAGATDDEPEPATASTAPERETGSGGTVADLLAALVETPGGGAVAIPPGTVIDGQYRVEHTLGQGGMGVVLRARDLRLEREVAIKVGSLVSASALPRAEREAIALAKLSHPNVVVVHQVGLVGGRLYIAMELVAGGNAREWLVAAPRTWRAIVSLYCDAGRGLAAAHAAGFVHRDFKPDNVLVGGDGRPRVADFGLVRDVASSDPTTPDGSPEADGRASERVTEAGVVVGTPAYMAPEQLEPGEIDAAADQFAFCVSLWEALHGARPFRASGRGAAMRAGLRRQIDAGRIAPGERRGVPRRVDRIARRGLAADPARRWPSINALIAALEREARRRPGRRGAVAGAIVAGAAAAIAIAWRPWASADAPAVPALHVGSPRTIDRASGPHDARVLVGDGRVARADGGAIELTATDGASPVRIAAPGGGVIVELHRSQEPGWLIATEQDGVACTIWHVAVDGRAPVRLADGCGAEVAVAPGLAAIAIARPGALVVRDALGTPPRWTHPLADADPGVPAWSPDGAKVAVASGRDTIVLEAATGDELARAPGRDGAVWWDARRLVHVRREGFGRSELRLLELDGTPADSHLHAEDGELGAPSLDGSGLFARRGGDGGHAYVVPIAPRDPIELESAPPLDTGATADVAIAGWTDGGQVVTIGMKRRAGTIVSVTAPGARGRALAIRAGSPGSAAVASGRVFYDVRGDDNLCERRAIDLATGAETRGHRVSCLEDVTLTCARDGGRCIEVSGKGARWLAATTGGVQGPAPAIDAPVLSPDGQGIATIADGRLSTRPAAGGADTPIVPVPPWPPDTRARVLAWSTDQIALLVALGDPVTRTHALVWISRDGGWRVIARGAHPIAAAQPSPDGTSIALTTRDDGGDEWIEFPIYASNQLSPNR